MHVNPFDITGKVMKGRLMVAEKRWGTTEKLIDWVDNGSKYALTLPGK